jgi:uncharacterized protein YegJ (DUF2314 family)
MYTLLNAIKQNKENPDTFEVPTGKEIQALSSGDHVKLCFIEKGTTPERMWVKIMSINGDNFQGILDNEPFGLDTINLGDIVLFNSKHILCVM